VHTDLEIGDERVEFALMGVRLTSR